MFDKFTKLSIMSLISIIMLQEWTVLTDKYDCIVNNAQI